MRRRTLIAAISVAAAFAGAANASAATLDVEPTKGSDANAGTAAAPLRTLAEALRRANAGDTVKLAGGVYHETWHDAFGNEGMIVPKGVTIQGVADPAQGRTVLSGGGAPVGLRLLGAAKVNDLLLSNFGDGLQASTGTSTLKGVDFSASTLHLAGNALMTYTADQPDPLKSERGGAFTSLDGPAIHLRGGAQLTIDGAAINGGNTPTCDLTRIGIDADFSSTLNASNLQMKNLPGGAVLAHRVNQFVVRTSTIAGAYPAGCTPAPAITVSDEAAGSVIDTHVNGDRTSGSVGLAIANRFGLSAQGSSFAGWATGIKVGETPGIVHVTQGQLRNNAFGLNAVPTARVQMTATHVEGNLTGVEAGALTLRDSTVASNFGTGVILDGPAADLGTVSSPGGNVLQGNGPNGAVRVGSANTSGKVVAAGNTWEPGVQGADGAGHYLSHPFLTGLSPLAAGRNFRLPVSGLASMQL